MPSGPLPVIRFDEADWARHRRVWSGFWSGDLGRPLVYAELGGMGWNPWRHLVDCPDDAATLAARVERHLASMTWHGDAWPNWMPSFGPGILSGMLGGSVQARPDTVWFGPGRYADLAIDALRPALDPSSPWWERVRSVTAVTARRLAGRATIAFTDLGGNLDILAHLRGSDALLLDLLDAPAETARLAREIGVLWRERYEALHREIAPGGTGSCGWLPIWSPGLSYPLQSDFAYMISPRQFARLVMPDLEACCDRMDHACYHLDGKGQLPHLDLLLSLKGLRLIQWIPGSGQPPPERWLDVLRRIREGGKRCHVTVSPDGARRIVKELGGRGFIFKVGGFAGADDADRFVEEITGEEAPRRR